MIRRRRRPREIAFSFDSFLDIVANVVGVIIRMILVVWVGARAYTSLQPLPPPSPSAHAVESRPVIDPLEQELERHRQELAQAQERLLEQLRQLDQVRNESALPAQELADLTPLRQALERERSALEQQGKTREQQARSAAVSLDELRQREKRLKEEIAALEKQAPPKETLRYRVPVSKPVQTEELIFECRGGRVTFLDIGALLEEVRRGLRGKGEVLRTRWETSDVTSAVGPFRLHYIVERERGFGLPVPDAHSNFRYGVSSWEVEPILPVRGETGTAALAPGSEFRQIVDVLDPQFTAVTFCVYPDSFALFRQLRDYLYQRDLTVAGRPLPEGTPIASSRHGSLSRGQ